MTHQQLRLGGDGKLTAAIVANEGAFGYAPPFVLPDVLPAGAGRRLGVIAEANSRAAFIVE